METSHSLDDAIPNPGASSDPAAPAWELVDAGRYRPRRIRGSFRGRELG
jgi:hypothetical protein